MRTPNWRSSRTSSSCSTCCRSSDRLCRLPDSWRLFVAAALPNEAAAAVWERLAPLRTQWPDTRWIKPDLLHLTLVFMGQVDAARAPVIESGIAAVARRHPQYETSVRGAGGHVDDRTGARGGGVAWLTLLDGASETADLALDVDATLGSATYDMQRRPRPHLTVARAIDAPALAALRDLSAALEQSWKTATVVLFRSHLGPGGSRYEPISTHQLSEEAPV